MSYSERFGVVPSPFQRDEIGAVLYSIARDQRDSHWMYAFSRMNFVVDTTCRLVSASGTENGYMLTGVNFNDFILLPMDAQKCALKHVALHWLNGHISSRVERLKVQYGEKVTGLATDLAISHLLDTTPLFEAGYVMPEPSLFGFEQNLTTEMYCQLLSGHMAEHRNKNESGDIPSLDDILQQHVDQQQQDPPVETSSIDEKTVETDTSPPPSFVNNGKIDENKLREAIQSGEVMPVPIDELHTEEAGSLLDNEIESMMREAAEKYKSHGWLTAEASEYIKSLKRDSVVPWNTVIQQKHRRHLDLLREATKMRPSRRHSSYFGRRHTSKCKIVVWIDTSGSMSPRELSLINAELDALERKNVHITVGHIDAAVCREPEVYRRGTELTNFFGRGGTDFRPAFNWMAEHMRVDPPDFAVYFTDGYGFAYQWEDLPGFTKTLDIVWVLMDTGMPPANFKSQVCSYGDAVAFDTHKNVSEHHYK